MPLTTTNGINGDNIDNLICFSVGVYSESDGELLCLLRGQLGGITHVMFSPDATKLYSGGRMVGNQRMYV